MPRKPEYSAIDLCDNVNEIVVSQIKCSECGRPAELLLPDFDAAKLWFDEGWRGNHTDCFCPKCSRKLNLI